MRSAHVDAIRASLVQLVGNVRERAASVDHIINNNNIVIFYLIFINE